MVQFPQMRAGPADTPALQSQREAQSDLPSAATMPPAQAGAFAGG